MNLYSFLTRHLIMPIGDFLTGQKVTSLLTEFDKMQYLPPAQLEAIANRKIQKTVSIAYHEVPLYKELYNNASVHPNDIKVVSDLYKLPIITKDILKSAFPEKCTRKTKHRYYDNSTSGSSGEPFISRNDLYSISESRALMFLRAMASGYSPGDCVFQVGPQKSRGVIKKIKDIMFRTMYLPAIALNDKLIDKHLNDLSNHKYDFIFGTTQSIYLFSLRAIEMGVSAKLTGVITWGSVMHEHYRRSISTAFNCKVFDTYGVSEGMQVAAQCGQSHGEYHQYNFHVVTEFCNNGQPVEDGTVGNIILTRLHPGAMPFIRYDVGDLGSNSTRVDCECGRTLPLINSIMGRTSDIIITPNGNKLVLHFFSKIFSEIRTVNLFQIHQTAPDSIHVLIVPSNEFQITHWEICRSKILKYGDENLDINMEIVNSIPVEKSGKRMYIKSSIL